MGQGGVGLVRPVQERHTLERHPLLDGVDQVADGVADLVVGIGGGEDGGVGRRELDGPHRRGRRPRGLGVDHPGPVAHEPGQGTLDRGVGGGHPRAAGHHDHRQPPGQPLQQGGLPRLEVLGQEDDDQPEVVQQGRASLDRGRGGVDQVGLVVPAVGQAAADVAVDPDHLAGEPSGTLRQRDQRLGLVAVAARPQPGEGAVGVDQGLGGRGVVGHRGEGAGPLGQDPAHGRPEHGRGDRAAVGRQVGRGQQLGQAGMGQHGHPGDAPPPAVAPGQPPADGHPDRVAGDDDGDRSQRVVALVHGDQASQLLVGVRAVAGAVHRQPRRLDVLADVLAVRSHRPRH